METILSFLDQTLANEEIKELLLKILEMHVVKDEQEVIEKEKEIFQLVKNEEIQSKMHTIVNDKNNKDYVAKMIEYFSRIPEDENYAKGYSIIHFTQTEKNYAERYTKGILFGMLLADLTERAKTDKQKAILLLFIKPFTEFGKKVQIHQYFAYCSWFYELIKRFSKELDMDKLPEYLKNN